jgi:hypothetical protein
MAQIDVNKHYEYTNQMAGSFSGGTWSASLGDVPHPVNYSKSVPGDPSSEMNVVRDLSAVTLGGFSGLNN